MNSPQGGQGAQAFTNPGGLEGLRKFVGANTKPVGGGVFNSSAEAPGYASSLPNGVLTSHLAARMPRAAVPGQHGMLDSLDAAMGGGSVPPGVAGINDGTAYRPGGRPTAPLAPPSGFAAPRYPRPSQVSLPGYTPRPYYGGNR